MVPNCPIEEAQVDAVYDAQKDFDKEIEPYYEIFEGLSNADKVTLHFNCIYSKFRGGC